MLLSKRLCVCFVLLMSGGSLLASNLPPDHLRVHSTPSKKHHVSTKVTINRFKIEGNCHIESKKLERLLKPFKNKKLNIYELHQAADVITNYYHSQGYFTARTFIPPQPIKNHTLHLIVVEGYLDSLHGIRIESNGKRVNPDFAYHLLNKILKPGTVFTQKKLERALLLLNDVPGMESSAVLYPGEKIGAGRLHVNLYDEPLIHGNLTTNNFGYVPTGRYELGVSLYIDNPFKHGSQFIFQGVQTDKDLTYSYGSFTLPVSYTGLRAGVEGSYTRFGANSILAAVPDSSGNANLKSGFLDYTIIRQRSHNLYGIAKLTNYRLYDYNNGITLDRRTLNYITLNLIGNWRDQFGGNSVNTYGVSAHSGNLNLNGIQPYTSTDESTARTAGGFLVLDFSASRLQSITNNFSTYWYLGGQIADKNLDPSQQYTLGGPYGVMGYPVGEALGDEGINFHADIRYDYFNMPWHGDFQTALIYSAGWVKLHKNSWNGWNAGNPIIQNTYTLQSLGLALSQSWSKYALLKFMVGRAVGANPGRDLTAGNNVDGTSRKYQFWFEGTVYF